MSDSCIIESEDSMGIRMLKSIGHFRVAFCLGFRMRHNVLLHEN